MSLETLNLEDGNKLTAYQVEVKKGDTFYSGFGNYGVILSDEPMIEPKTKTRVYKAEFYGTFIKEEVIPVQFIRTLSRNSIPVQQYAWYEENFPEALAQIELECKEFALED